MCFQKKRKMSVAMANAIDPPIFKVVEIVGALLIHEHMVINIAHLMDSHVSCDLVIFIKFNQWHALLESVMVIPNMPVLLMTRDR